MLRLEKKRQMNDLVFVCVCFLVGWLAAILSSMLFFHDGIAKAAAQSLGASAAIAAIALWHRRQKRKA